MKKLSFCLFLLCFFCLLFSCRQKARQRQPDKRLAGNNAYKTIYDSYQNTPLDSVELRMEDFLKKYPQHSLGWSLYGWVLFENNHPDLSLAAYKKTISFSPQNALGYAGAGAVYNTLNQNDSAENYLLKAIALNDSSAYTFLNLSLLYMKKNEREKSFAFADSSFARGDSLAPVCAGLSFVYHRQNEETKSREMEQRAIQFGLKDTALFNKVLSGEIKIEDYYRHK